jgi:hypothetical protein
MGEVTHDLVLKSQLFVSRDLDRFRKWGFTTLLLQLLRDDCGNSVAVGLAVAVGKVGSTGAAATEWKRDLRLRYVHLIPRLPQLKRV